MQERGARGEVGGKDWKFEEREMAWVRVVRALSAEM